MPYSEPLPFPPPRALRILYVDDEANLRRVVAAFLRGRRHAVETAPDGAEALQMVFKSAASSASAYDVMITDLGMPELDGVSLIKALREANLPLRIIVYSSSLTPQVVEELTSLQVAATLPKGTRAELLAETVLKVAQMQE